MKITIDISEENLKFLEDKEIKLGNFINRKIAELRFDISKSLDDALYQQQPPIENKVKRIF